MAMVGIKINSLAKELNMKSKDLIEVLVKNGFGTKGSSAALSDEEFGFLMDTLTRNHQTSDLNSYLSGETYVRVETEERIQKRLALHSLSGHVHENSRRLGRQASTV